MPNKIRFFIFCLLACTAIGASSNVAQARIGDSFSKSRKDDFLRYVRFDTAAHMVNGEIVTRFWGMLYKNRMEFRMTLSPDSNITSMEFLIDSVFLDSSWARSLSMASNFIRIETTQEDSSDVAELANEIEYVHKRNLHFLGDYPKLPDTPTDAYQVILWQRDAYDMPLKRSVLHLSHIRRGNKLWLSMKITMEGLTEPRK